MSPWLMLSGSSPGCVACRRRPPSSLCRAAESQEERRGQRGDAHTAAHLESRLLLRRKRSLRKIKNCSEEYFFFLSQFYILRPFLDSVSEVRSLKQVVPYKLTTHDVHLKKSGEFGS